MALAPTGVETNLMPLMTAPKREFRKLHRRPRRWRRPLTLGLSAVLMCCVAACRDDSEPSGRHNVNLGTSERPLLPTPSRSYDGAALRGKATVVPLADLGSGGTEMSSADQDDADRQAIRELFEEVSMANAERNLEALVELLVERQREAARKTVPATWGALQVVAGLSALLPSVSGSAPAISDDLGGFLGKPMEVGQLTFESRAKAWAPLGTGRLEFEKVRGQWFFVWPVLASSVE